MNCTASKLGLALKSSWQSTGDSQSHHISYVGFFLGPIARCIRLTWTIAENEITGALEISAKKLFNEAEGNNKMSRACIAGL